MKWSNLRSPSNLRILINVFALDPAAYLVLGLLARIALDTVFAITSGGDGLILPAFRLFLEIIIPLLLVLAEDPNIHINHLIH
jgi:hypothetical protein